MSSARTGLAVRINDARVRPALDAMKAVPAKTEAARPAARVAALVQSVASVPVVSANRATAVSIANHSSPFPNSN